MSGGGISSHWQRRQLYVFELELAPAVGGGRLEEPVLIYNLASTSSFETFGDGPRTMDADSTRLESYERHHSPEYGAAGRRVRVSEGVIRTDMCCLWSSCWIISRFPRSLRSCQAFSVYV